MAVPKVGVVDGHAESDSLKIEVVRGKNEVNGARHVGAEAVWEPVMLTKNFVV